MRALAVLVCVIAFEANAVKVGETLYTRREAKLLAKADANAAVVKTLPVGTPVIWDGPDARNRQFHKVRFEEVTGFLAQSDLTPVRPAAEAEAQPISVDEVRKQLDTAAVRQLETIEAVNDAAATAAAIDEHVKANKLVPK